MTAKKINLRADKRKITGRKVKQLRQDGILPANIYGKKVKSTSIQVDLKNFVSVYEKAGETQVLQLTVANEKKARPVLIHKVQQDPVTDLFLHADFRQVDLTQKIEAEVPVELVGEAPGAIKGILVHALNSIKVEALPNDLPEKFAVDISKLEEIGHSITLKDLKLDTAKVKILEEDTNKVVARIDALTEEEPEPAPAAVEGEAAAEGEVKAGEEPKEGEAAKPSEVKAGEKPETKKGEKPAEAKPAENKPAESQPAAKPKAKPAEKKQ